MIDINELRRLAQAATPGPWIAAGPSFGESLPKYLNEVAVDREGDEDDGYSICNAPIGLNEECSDDMAFIAEANPLTIEELLDRLEAAEKSRDDLLACLGEWLDKTKWVQQGVNEGTISAKYLGLHRADVMSSLLGETEKARDALRAEIERLQSNLSASAQAFVQLEAVAAEARRNDATAMSWISEAKHAIGYEGDMPGFIGALRELNDVRRRVPAKITVSQAPHSQYAKGWNDCMKAIKEETK
jgi:hypothetical protein